MPLVDTRTPDPKKLIPGATGDWEIVIGMEVHAQVLSESKLFSGASTSSAPSRTTTFRWSMPPCQACCLSSTSNACGRRCVRDLV